MQYDGVVLPSSPRMLAPARLSSVESHSGDEEGVEGEATTELLPLVSDVVLRTAKKTRRDHQQYIASLDVEEAALRDLEYRHGALLADIYGARERILSELHKRAQLASEPRPVSRRSSWCNSDNSGENDTMAGDDDWGIQFHKVMHLEGLDLAGEGVNEQFEEAKREALATSAARKLADNIPSMLMGPQGGSTESAAKQMFYAMFPPHIAEALCKNEKVAPEYHDSVTFFFSDVVGYTVLSEKVGPHKVASMLDRLYTVMDRLATRHCIFKLETIGDAYVAVTNLTTPQDEDHAVRMARFAVDALHAARQIIVDPDNPYLGTVRIRIGLHTGPIVSSVVGSLLPKYSCIGDTINTASRMESTSLPLCIQCSQKCADLIREQIGTSNVEWAEGMALNARGCIDVKGKGNMMTHWLIGKSVGGVTVYTEPIKTLDSMSQSLLKFAVSDNTAGNWPLAANILNPVRTNIIVDGAAKILQVLGYLMESSHEPQKSMVVCRVVNKFHSSVEESAKSESDAHCYKSVKVSVIYRSGTVSRSNLKIIGEIEIHDAELYHLKCRIAILRKIVKAQHANLVRP